MVTEHSKGWAPGTDRAAGLAIGGPAVTHHLQGLHEGPCVERADDLDWHCIREAGQHGQLLSRVEQKLLPDKLRALKEQK